MRIKGASDDTFHSIEVRRGQKTCVLLAQSNRCLTVSSIMSKWYQPNRNVDFYIDRLKRLQITTNAFGSLDRHAEKCGPQLREVIEAVQMVRDQTEEALRVLIRLTPEDEEPALPDTYRDGFENVSGRLVRSSERLQSSWSEIMESLSSENI